MKSLVIYAVLATAIFSGTGCTIPVYDKATTVILDRTDSMTQITMEEVLYHTGVHYDIWKSISLRVTTITDVAFNKAYACSFAPAGGLMNNTYQREQERDTFTHHVEHIFKGICRDTIGKDYSLIYATIVREIRHLMTRSDVLEHELIINSDLFENGDTLHGELSVYHAATVDTLLHYPAVFEEQLENTSQEPLPHDLSTLSVIFVFQPKDRSESKVYEALVRIYSKMIGQRGGKTSIYANL